MNLSPEEYSRQMAAFDAEIGLEAQAKADPNSIAGFQLLQIPSGMQATEFVLDGFLPTGVTVIAGEPGVGKTTNLVPMAASVAHLTPGEWGMHPKRRRHVLWLSEHAEQVFDTMEALLSLDGSASRQEFSEWFHVASTQRSTPEELSALILLANERFSWTNERGAVVRPLIVWDTAAATIEVDDEKDNSTISKAIALAKQSLGGGALWVVAHTPKASKGAKSADMMSARGASAFEGDANTTAFLFKDPAGSYVLSLGKIRFSPEYTEMHFSSCRLTQTITDAFDGQKIDKTVVAGLPTRGSKEMRAQEQADLHRQAQMDGVLQAAVEAARDGELCSQNNLRQRLAVPMKNDFFGPIVNQMIAAGTLVRVAIPQDVKKRAQIGHQKRDCILPAGVDPQAVFERAIAVATGQPMPEMPASEPPASAVDWLKAVLREDTVPLPVVKERADQEGIDGSSLWAAIKTGAIQTTGRDGTRYLKLPHARDSSDPQRSPAHAADASGGLT